MPKTIQEMKALIDKKNPMLPRWVPVSEREPDKTKPQIVMFGTGIVSSVKHRRGQPFGEPDSDTLAWRCDCCGRFADPIAWLENMPKAPAEVGQ